MKIALLGDIGLLGNYSLCNNPRLFEKLTEVQGFLKQFDLVVGNLETPFSRKKKTWGAKSSYICTDPNDVEILKFLGIDVVTIANNHMFDFGKEGFETTIFELDKSGIAWFGANGQDYKLEKDGNRIIFNGFCCYSSNPLKISKRFGKYGINRFHLTEAKDLLNNLANEGFLNIFAIHSGVEHVNTPSVEQIYAARELAMTQPFVWYGHHPHAVQGVEKIDDSVIAHSLGNFCFAGNNADANRPVVELSENNRTGMILVLEIENNKILKYNCILTHIGEDGHIRILKNSKDVDEYSDQITSFDKNITGYKNARRVQRNTYLNKRKEMRNFKWIMKHLRPRYARLLIDNRLNARKYFKSIIQPLKSKGYEL